MELSATRIYGKNEIIAYLRSLGIKPMSRRALIEYERQGIISIPRSSQASFRTDMQVGRWEMTGEELQNLGRFLFNKKLAERVTHDVPKASEEGEAAQTQIQNSESEGTQSANS